MPIGASAGTLDIENATLRSNAIAVLTNLVTGNDAVRSSGAPTLEVYGDPSNGGNEARLELVSNLSVENSKSFTRLTSNAGVFSIQSGTDGSTNGPITFGGFSNERMRITADGNVGIGTDDPNAKLDVQGSAVITGLTYGIKSTGTLGSDKTEGWHRLLIGGLRSGSSAIRTKCELQVSASGLHQTLTFDFNHMISLSDTSGNSFNLLGNDHYISRVGVTKLRLADAGSNQFALDMYIDDDVVPLDREWTITLYTEGGSLISEASTFLEKITATPSASIEISTDTTIFGIVGSTTSKTLVMHENGNVGIGVTGPQTTLDVNGTIKNTNPAFWAYTSGGATTTLAGIFDGGGSPARALFSSTDLNIGSCYSTSNGRFTAPVAGRYAFFGQVLLRRGSNTGHVSSELTLYKNGTNVNGRGLAYSTVSNDSGEHDNLRLFYILDLAKDQYVQIGMYSIGTGSDVYYGERLANFSGYLLG